MVRARVVEYVIAALISTFPLACLAQPPSSCDQAEVVRTATRVQSVRKQLLNLPIGDGPGVSPAAQQEIVSMKSALAALIDAYMGCVSSQPDGTKVRNELSALTNAFELPQGQVLTAEQIPAEFGKFGFKLWFDVRAIQNPRLIGITANFSIECGGDTVLLVFAPKADTWEEVLRWQKQPYPEVDGGTMAFGYEISPPDNSGGWFLVEHDIAPWCSSTWSSIRYSVLKPTSEPLQPKVLFSGDDYMWWGSEDYGRLTVDKNAFDLRFHSSSIDAGVHNRVWIRHFSVIGDEVKRTQPVAVSPRDFVDEWIVSPWEQAAQWSSKAVEADLRRLHELVRAINEDSLLEYTSVHRCSKPAGHYQVEVGEYIPPDYRHSRSFYFQVTANDTYFMTKASRTPDPRCKGRNILEEMSTR